MAKSKAEYWLTEEGQILLKGWARDGLTDEQIAYNMKISPATLYNYKNKYVEILESLKEGKEVIDRQVENALLKKALDGDVTAMIFWLKNRKSKEWRDKVHTEHEGNLNINNPFNDLSTEELRKLTELDGT